ncbi:MAG: formylmethanofuran dehydrogenase subunit B [Candidatus Lokiarchaeota archaeon]|nr:formylmethanofuran dehydrogenase subunit B [Candidatus Lokiarchaeota archaeon]MBD3202033.1 formylmethanofuran dehydrogenase subunit B [Candidatus Lokiarchaeota archaeon]
MEKITCTGCSLLCDDIIVKKDGSNIEEIIGACLKGVERFEMISSKHRVLKPYIRDGDSLEEIDWDTALNKVVELINKSNNPLLYGFSNTTCEAQLKAIELAREINGFIDSNSTICQGKALNVAKETGFTTSTLTEVINKSDVMILWGFNAVESIPRLLNKILFSRGKFRMTGREIKTIIILDPIKTDSFNVMGPRDIALLIEPDKDIELIETLKEICCTENALPSNEVAGLDKDDFKRLQTNLTNSEYISIFVGQGLLKNQEGKNPLKSLFELIDIINERNKKGRASIILAGGHFNMMGFEHVALSNTGQNQSLSFNNHQLIESQETIISKIENKDFDLSIILGTDPISHLPMRLSKKLASKPIILIDNSRSGTYLIADLILPTSISGLETDGTAIRLDNVPIKLKKVIDAPQNLLSDEDLLNKIIEKLREKREGI